MQKILKTFALGAVTLASCFSALPSLAQNVGVAAGSYKAIACNGGTSLFERTKGTDKEYDIGNTKMKSVLVNSGDNQTSALQILYTYTPPTPSEFQSFLIDFRDDGQTRNKIKVHFCFRRANGGVLDSRGI